MFYSTSVRATNAVLMLLARVYAEKCEVHLLYLVIIVQL